MTHTVCVVYECVCVHLSGCIKHIVCMGVCVLHACI